MFPRTLDEMVSADHAVRVIDAFVDSLDLHGLGFSKVKAEATGRPPYRPGDLLKLYVYGYLNQVRSSRRLEREAERNLEIRWLIDQVTPSFKTIADFRRDHAAAIVGVCRSFTRFCRQLGLYGGALVAIDGTKIEAVASRKKVITPKILKKREEAMDRKIAEYLKALDEADASESGTEEIAKVDVQQALAALREHRDEVGRQARMLADQDLTQLVIGEEEARLMRTARHAHQVAYNAQTAVDDKHGLIAAFDLTNECNDQSLLYPMASQAKAELGVEKLSVVADTGYSTGAQEQACAQDGITAAVPRAETVNPKGEQYFSRDDFTYDAARDTYRCPAGETLTRRDVDRANGKTRYGTKACAGCALKPSCTKGNYRVVIRHIHEDGRQAMHVRATSGPGLMKARRCLAEHPFGIIKWMMGYPRFLLRGLKKAKAEFALGMLSFNLKRIITILGVPTILAALQPRPA
jgi:transposase